MEYFPKQLKRLRIEAGHTQKTFAPLVGISETGFASWEQGRSEPSLSDIRRLQKLFDVSFEELIGTEDECADLRVARIKTQPRREIGNI